MADRKLPPDRESWDASEERLRSHIPNVESFLQDLYTRSTGLSAEPTSAQFNTLSARVDANSAKAAVTSVDVTSNHLSVLSQAISVLSQQVSVMSNRISNEISDRKSAISNFSVVDLPFRISGPLAGATSVGLSIYTAASTIAIDALGIDDILIRTGDGGNIQIGDSGGAQNFTIRTGTDDYRVRFPLADWFWAADRFKIEHVSAAITLGVADDVAIERAGLSALLISAVSTKITGALHVSGVLSAPILDTLSNQISVLSQQVSILSQQISVLSQGLSVVSVGVDRVSNAVSNETSNRISADNALSAKIDTVSNQVSVLSQQVSIHSQQISVLSQQVSVLSQSLSVLSQSISVLSQQVSILSVRASHPGLGQCRLSVKSTTSLVLQPYNGSQLWINGSAFSVPSAGVEIGTGGLTSATTYNVYAFVSATSVITLEINTTAHATDTAAGNVGVEIKSGDSTRTLVGKTRLNASVNFVNSVTQRFLINWFNRLLLGMTNNFTVDRTTTSASFVELNTEIRCEFLAWANEAVHAIGTGGFTNSGAGSIAQIGLGFDGTTIEAQEASDFISSSISIAWAIAAIKLLSEGYHYSTVIGAIAGGNTLTLYGGTPSTAGTRTCGLTMGIPG